MSPTASPEPHTTSPAAAQRPAATEGKGRSKRPDVQRRAKAANRTHRLPLQVSYSLAGVVVALVAIFFVTTTNNLFLIMNQVEAVKDGPYPVSVATGRIETLLVQLQTLSTAPRALNDPSHAAGLERAYDAINEQMLDRIDFIVTNSTTDDLEANGLRVEYQDLMERQAQLVALCADPAVGDAEVEDFVRTRIDPIINGLLLIDVDLLERSTALVNETYSTVTGAIQQVIIVSAVLMLAVLVAIIVYLSVLSHANRLQRRLYDELEDALATARSASEAKSAFLANMSHDIRTPMNAIVGLTSIAQTHVDDPERTTEYLNRITISSKHLLNLISDILDMSKIESGKFQLNELPFDLPEVTAKFIDMVYPQMRAKHLRFDVCILDIVHENLIGDTLRLSQVFLNLASNAIKYTPEGGYVRITLTELPSKRAGYALMRFEVQDTGIGMDPAFLDHVFDVFERERNDTTNFIQGTGLGMAIVKNIVDRMGGDIAVQSTPGEGSTFTVTMPLRIDVAQAEVAPPELNGRALRLLFADDNESVRGNLAHIMDEWGVEADLATSGQEAVEMAKRAQEEGRAYDGIIMDWIMPELDGVSTTHHLASALGDQMPLVTLASYEASSIKDQAQAAGVTSFVAKPLFRSRLREALMALVDVEEAASAPDPKAASTIEGRCLLVEDNEINREIALELIMQFGVKVDEARDGLEAVEKLDEAEPGTYGLVFMDLQMPRMDGLTATRTIIEHERERGTAHVPIIAMTANAFSEDREAAIEAGMDGFLTKPISVRMLEETLRAYLS